MTHIDLKFSPEMAALALAGRKICTLRTTVKGAPGDTFDIDGVRFRLLDVIGGTATELVTTYCRLEGFDYVQDAAETIAAIYPGIAPDAWMNAHFFARCP